MMYTRLKKMRDTKKKKQHHHRPTLQHNQFMKSNKDNKLDPKGTLTYSKNVYIKEHKIAWSVKSKSLNAIQFLSFHKV